MRKYDRKVLYALVVAYMNGIIGKKPLKKWIDKNEIFKNILRKIVLFISFGYLLILIQDGYLFDKTEEIVIQNYIFKVYRLYNVVLFVPLVIVLYKLVSYIYKIYYVNKTMNSYYYEENDIKVIDNVTFKIET